MRPGVRYYCPPGVAAPAHRPDIGGGLPVDVGAGPDAAQGGPGGGMVFGGIYTDEPGWLRTEAGWWVHLGRTMPQHLWRTQTHPRIVRWCVIVGALPEHRWRIPVLLTPIAGDDAAASGYVSALERVWRGAEGWQDDPDLARLQDDLHAAAQGVVLRGLGSEWGAITDVAIRLLEHGARITRHELAAAGWLSELMLLRIVAGAAGQQAAEAAP